MSDPSKLHDERGMSLIELMIYSALSLIVLSVAGALLVSALRTQNSVTDSSHVVQGATLLQGSLQDTLRNSSAASVQTIPAPAGASQDGPDQILRAKTFTATTGGSDGAIDVSYVAHCVAWYYVALTHSIYRTSSSATVPTPSSASETGAMPGGWTLLASDVYPQSAAGGSYAGGIFSGSIVLDGSVPNGEVDISYGSSTSHDVAASYTAGIVPLPLPTAAVSGTSGSITCT